jgi:hypothetical protein
VNREFVASTRALLTYLWYVTDSTFVLPLRLLYKPATWRLSLAELLSRNDTQFLFFVSDDVTKLVHHHRSTFPYAEVFPLMRHRQLQKGRKSVIRFVSQFVYSLRRGTKESGEIMHTDRTRIRRMIY